MSNESAKKLIIAKQLNRKKELIRKLFRESADGSLGSRYLGRTVAETSPTETNNQIGLSDEKTVFEQVETVCRPAIASQSLNQRIENNICKLHHTKVKSKSSRRHKRRDTKNSQRYIQSDREVNTRIYDNLNLTEVTSQRDFTVALKIMIEVKKCQILENVLDDDETEVVRQFFETEMCSPSYRAKTRLFDVMLIYPEFIPVTWAGPHIGYLITHLYVKYYYTLKVSVVRHTIRVDEHYSKGVQLMRDKVQLNLYSYDFPSIRNEKEKKRSKRTPREKDKGSIYSYNSEQSASSTKIQSSDSTSNENVHNVVVSNEALRNMKEKADNEQVVKSCMTIGEGNGKEVITKKRENSGEKNEKEDMGKTKAISDDKNEKEEVIKTKASSDEKNEKEEIVRTRTSSDEKNEKEVKTKAGSDEKNEKEEIVKTRANSDEKNEKEETVKRKVSSGEDIENEEAAKPRVNSNEKNEKEDVAKLKGDSGGGTSMLSNAQEKYGTDSTEESSVEEDQEK
ncbi:hypothetical protein DICVIV_04147 [Dictyocaulus viviparus]|uniref:DUF7774 domain-containing protein n=1 Tax=Dictyocaulus viviparus TaxID=29172 RepID=A0A0D8Y5A1_DICVI|nr:hypothetical protein DICVIV_04147 [Dictyocaulus viviparus]